VWAVFSTGNESRFGISSPGFIEGPGLSGNVYLSCRAIGLRKSFELD